MQVAVQPNACGRARGQLIEECGGVLHELAGQRSAGRVLTEVGREVVDLAGHVGECRFCGRGQVQLPQYRDGCGGGLRVALRHERAGRRTGVSPLE